MKIIVDCVICGKTFEGKRHDAKYCSSNCRNKGKAITSKDHYRRKNGIESNSKKCKYCDKMFDCTDFRQKYCSDTCRNKAKKGKTRKHEKGRYRRRRYVVNTSSKNGQLDKFERDFNYFKPCKFDEDKENLYYIHDFNDDDISSSLIKYTNTNLSEKEFEYYNGRGNLVFYEMLT